VYRQVIACELALVIVINTWVAVTPGYYTATPVCGAARGWSIQCTVIVKLFIIMFTRGVYRLNLWLYLEHWARPLITGNRHYSCTNCRCMPVKVNCTWWPTQPLCWQLYRPLTLWRPLLPHG